MKRFFYFFFLVIPFYGNSQLIVSYSDPATLVSTYLTGCNVSLSNVTFMGQTGATGVGQIGYFSNGNSTNLGISEGIVLASGEVTNIPGPVSALWSADMGGGGDSSLNALAGYSTYDAAVLEFDIVSYGSQISVRYVFGSEEYLDYVGSSYNDVFGFFISGPNPSGGNYVNENIALIPGTSYPVSINNVHSTSYSQYYVNNEALNGQTIVMDGFTVPLSASANVIPGATYHIKIAVADAGDHILDSGVFLMAYSMGSGPGGISLSTHQQGAVCPGSSAGVTAWVHVNGGSGPFTYQWSNGVTDSVATNLSAGTYQITVSDASSCAIQATIVVENFSFEAETVAFPPSCNGSDGIIMVNVTDGLIEPYSYLWSHGPHVNTTNASVIESNLPAGAYSVTVINGLGCTVTETVLLSDNNGPVVVADTILNATCAGNDGELSVHIDNPAAAPYTFELTGNATQTGNTGASFTGLAGGSYYLAVTDSNNCVSVYEYNIDSPPIPYAMYTYQINQNHIHFTNLSSPGNYFWDFGDGSGSTDVNPDHLYATTGDFIVCLWYFGPCGTTSFCDTIPIIIIDHPLHMQNGWTVYPNPSQGILYVETEGERNEVSLTLYDQTGRVFYQGYTEGKRTEINLPQLNPGMYFLKTGDRVTKVIMEQ